MAVVVFTMAMAVLLPPTGGGFGPDTPIGWLNRFMVLGFVAWLMTVAGAALKVGPQTAGRNQDFVAKVGLGERRVGQERSTVATSSNAR